MFFVGIDWSEKYLDYCLTNNSGDVILRNRVENNDDGFNAMLSSFAKETIDLSLFAVAIESPHQRVVGFDTLRTQPKDFLLARGICLYPAKSNARLRLSVNPGAVHDYRKSRKPSGSKSDTADALRRSHAKDNGRLRPFATLKGRLTALFFAELFWNCALYQGFGTIPWRLFSSRLPQGYARRFKPNLFCFSNRRVLNADDNQV